MEVFAYFKLNSLITDFCGQYNYTINKTHACKHNLRLRPHQGPRLWALLHHLSEYNTSG